MGVESDQDPSYVRLAKLLHSQPFYSVIPRDINRAKDGEGLRNDFAEEQIPSLEEEDFVLLKEEKCSYLEMIIALSIRMSELDLEGETDEKSLVKRYFWELLDNLGLLIFDDRTWVYGTYETIIRDSLRAVSERTFRYDGVGGFFPLREPKSDQRNLEIWYEMNAYLMEKYSIFEG